MTSNKKPTFIDRARKLGEKLFTKRNMAIAAPIVAGAAALSSKRVRDAVGDAAKSAGDAIAGAAPASRKPTSTVPKPAASTSAKRSAAGKAGAAKANAKPAATTTKPKAASKSKTASKSTSKPRAKAATKGAAGEDGGNA